MKKVLVILADGFEELEALAPIDILRRAGASVTVAGLGKKEIHSSRNILIVCDDVLENVKNDSWNAVVLPGGMPGATNLASSSTVKDCIMSTFNNSGLVCAICASPAVVLAPLGILKGRKATCYPGMEIKNSNIDFVKERVVVDGNIITSCAAGCATEFALNIVEQLFGSDKAKDIAGSIVCESF